MNNSSYNTLYIYYIKGKFRGNITSPSYLGCWIEEGDSFLFFSCPQPEIVHGIIERQKNLILKDVFEVDYFEWIGGKIGPLEIGKIRIIPVWETLNTKKDTDILLDPGVVFGAGSHATTLNCLKAINFLFTNFSDVKTVLDLGCGTGILSLVCVKLGAKKVLAVDLNPLACITTRKNLRLNYMEDKIVVAQGKGQELIFNGFELLVANIHYDVLKEITCLLKFNNFKYLVFSGIFESQAKDIIYNLVSMGIRVYEIFGLDSGWPTIVGGRK